MCIFTTLKEFILLYFLFILTQYYKNIGVIKMLKDNKFSRVQLSNINRMIDNSIQYQASKTPKELEQRESTLIPNALIDGLEISNTLKNGRINQDSLNRLIGNGHVFLFPPGEYPNEFCKKNRKLCEKMIILPENIDIRNNLMVELLKKPVSFKVLDIKFAFEKNFQVASLKKIDNAPKLFQSNQKTFEKVFDSGSAFLFDPDNYPVEFCKNNPSLCKLMINIPDQSKIKDTFMNDIINKPKDFRVLNMKHVLKHAITVNPMN